MQRTDVRRFLLEVRIVRGHVALDPMGLKPVLAPHPRHHHVADFKLRGELAHAPMRGAIRRCTSHRSQDTNLEMRREHCGDLPKIPAVESGNPLLNKPLALARHKSAAALNALGYFIPRMALGQQ